MFVHVIFGPKLFLDQRQNPLFRFFRFSPREIVEVHLDQHVLPTHHRIGGARRQNLAQKIGNRILRGASDDVSRRTLQHRHMCCLVCKRWNERHCRCATSDHNNPLAAIFQVLRPFLRMHDLAAESLHSRPARHVAFRVVVVTAAHIKKIADELNSLTVCAGRLDHPSRVFR